MLKRVARPFEEIRHEFRPVLRLAIPLVAGEIGWMVMGIVDTIMVGRLPDSAGAIGAVSLATMIFYSIAGFFGAILLGLDTLVSQSHGAGRTSDCHQSFWSGLWLAALLSPLSYLAVNGVAGGMDWMGVNPAIRPQTLEYTSILNYGTPFLLVFFALRRYLQAVGAAGIVGFSIISSNVLNAAGNWGLIYGHFGLPAMGLNGSAWATFWSRVYMTAVLAIYIVEKERRSRAGLFAHPWPDLARIWALLKLGVPAAVHMGLEFMNWALATLFIARLTPVALAAHQIALNMASLTFMVPLGISSAAAVRVGNRIGAGDLAGAARSGSAAIAIGASFMLAAAVTFLLVPGPITRLYTRDPAVVDLSVRLLGIAAVFQFFDGLQITTAGALRGAGDTHTAAMCNLIFYWIIGLPIGYILCFRFGYGVIGIWSGLCLALVLIGFVLQLVWRRRAGRLDMSE